MGVDNSGEAAKPTESSISEPPQSETKPNPLVIRSSPLSKEEIYQLTLYKWRYELEYYGFNEAQIQDLMFLKWRHTPKTVLP